MDLKYVKQVVPSLQEEGWVVCRAFKKRATSLTRSIIDNWDSTYSVFPNPNNTLLTTFIDQYPNFSPHLNPKNLYLKQETELEGGLSKLLQYPDAFIQLPHLESSPSFPVIKPSSSSHLSIAAGSAQENEEDREKSYAVERVTDWRALDKFVASQLSQEDGFVAGDFEAGENGSEMALLLLENGRGGVGKMKESSVDDIGFCVFEQRN